MDPKKNLTLTKMLSPEEMALLGTMQSTLNELLSLQQGNASMDNQLSDNMNPDVMEALKKLAAQNGLADNAEGAGDPNAKPKNPVEKEDNGRTANETAEQRANPTTDINDQNINEVGKALLSLLLGKTMSQQVTKSQNYYNQNNNFGNNDIAKALVLLSKRLDSIEQFNSNVLDALGFTEKIEKSQTLQQIAKSQNNNLPVQNIDATGVVNELVNVIKSLTQNQKPNNNVGNGQFNNDWNGMQAARKNLADAMPFIFENSLSREQKYK